jgi:hypothetical protein
VNRAVPIRTPNELYAHAIAIEREAADTYAEFAQRMDDFGNEDVAKLFRTLAVFEAEHLDTLEARTMGVAVPKIALGEYASGCFRIMAAWALVSSARAASVVAPGASRPKSSVMR